jgi:3-methyladenine DNA glycosylase/8-oxoguanine DNA glycosylase
VASWPSSSSKHQGLARDRKRSRRRARDVPAEIVDAAGRMARYLRGEVQDLSAVRLDVTGLSVARQRTYEALRAAPAGLPIHVAELTALAGLADGRAVLRALALNPFPLLVPCHRVLTTVGAPASVPSRHVRARLLASEGAHALSRLRAESTVRSLPGRRFLYDPQAAERALRHGDPKLAALIDRIGPFGMTIRHGQSPFETLARSIIYQQLAGASAAAIFARVKALGSKGFPAPEEILAMPDRRLREAGASASKLLSLRDLARKTMDGVVPSLRQLHRMSDEEIVERLTSVRGIGRWTVEILLIFRLGRPDVLPIDDYGVRKGLAFTVQARSLPSPAKLREYGERWRPYRSFASWYMWRAADLANRLRVRIR